MSEEWVDQILKGLDRGEFPTEAQVRRLIDERRVDRETIQVFVDAALQMARDVTDKMGQRLQARRDLFDPHAGQFISADSDK